MLRIVPKSQVPETPQQRVRRRLRATRTNDVLQCHVCQGRELMETLTGVGLVNGKPKGGTRTLLCVACHRVGQRVVVA